MVYKERRKKTEQDFLSHVFSAVYVCSVNAHFNG